jgi:FAD/FMN-containing dehydrogenase
LATRDESLQIGTTVAASIADRLDRNPPQTAQADGVNVATAVEKPVHWTSSVPPENKYADEARGLAEELRRHVDGEVRFTSGDRALYATDLSVFRQVPIGVVIPRSIDDVIATVAVCRGHDVPILPRGGGTSLAGQTCNVAVVIDFSKYLHHILEYDPFGHSAWVEPGVICDQLRHRAWRDHLTWAPDPATHAYNTFGGMIGNNSCGSHSLVGGKTVDNIEALDILTYNGDRLTVERTGDAGELDSVIRRGGPVGQLYGNLRQLRDRCADEIRKRFPDIPRRVSGYNLDDLLPERGFDVAKALVGSEGTLAMVLKARVRLIPRPAHRALLLLGYDGMADAGDHVPELLELHPHALEGIHESVPRNMEIKHRPLPGAELLPDGRMTLLLEFGGASQDEANSRAHDAVVESRQAAGGRWAFACARMKTTSRKSGRCARPALRRHASRTRSRGGRAGKTRPCIRQRKVLTCETSRRCSGDTDMRGRGSGTSARAVFTFASTSTFARVKASRSTARLRRKSRTSS